MSLKLLTFNIHKGFNWSNTQITLHQLKENLRIEKPDIVFLQEVVGYNKSHAKKFADWIDNHFQFLADDLWPHSHYSQHAVYDHRHHGNVILSKYPILKSEVIDISTNKYEKRSILFCEIDCNGTSIHTYCVHLNLLHKERVTQYKNLKEIIQEKSSNQEQVILAGDFNDWNKKATSHLFESADLCEAYKEINGHYAKTFPSLFPMARLDRIYTKGMKIKKANVLQGEWKHISDHLPIVIEADLL